MYHLITFLSGAVIEICCVAWVHYSERDKPFKTAICSIFVALAQVLGIGEAIHNRLDAGLFIFGYGVGTYASVSFKKWKKNKT